MNLEQGGSQKQPAYTAAFNPVSLESSCTPLSMQNHFIQTKTQILRRQTRHVQVTVHVSFAWTSTSRSAAANDMRIFMGKWICSVATHALQECVFVFMRNGCSYK